MFKLPRQARHFFFWSVQNPVNGSCYRVIFKSVVLSPEWVLDRLRSLEGLEGKADTELQRPDVVFEEPFQRGLP